jgi:hypothetical protein
MIIAAFIVFVIIVIVFSTKKEAIIDWTKLYLSEKQYTFIQKEIETYINKITKVTITPDEMSDCHYMDMGIPEKRDYSYLNFDIFELIEILKAKNISENDLKLFLVQQELTLERKKYKIDEYEKLLSELNRTFENKQFHSNFKFYQLRIKSGA